MASSTPGQGETGQENREEAQECEQVSAGKESEPTTESPAKQEAYVGGRRSEKTAEFPLVPRQVAAASSLVLSFEELNPWHRRESKL